MDTHTILEQVRKSIVPDDQEDDSLRALQTSSIFFCWCSNSVSDVNEVRRDPPAADSMLRVRFRPVRSRTLAMPMGPMDLDIGRKARSGEKYRMTTPGGCKYPGQVDNPSETQLLKPNFAHNNHTWRSHRCWHRKLSGSLR